MSILTGTISTAGLFTLWERSQIAFLLIGGANASRDSKIRLILDEGIAGRAPVTLAMADFGVSESLRSTYKCEVSVSLRPGRYRWQTEIIGSGGHSANTRGGALIVPAQHQFTTSGVGGLTAVISTTGGRRASVWARIPQITLTPADRIEGKLNLIEFSETDPSIPERILFSTTILQAGTTYSGPIDSQVYPYYPRAGFRYRATFTSDCNLPVPPACSLEHTID